MSFIEKAISNAILAMIRSRRKPPAVLGRDSGSPPSIAPAKVREAQFSDYAAVTNLKRSWGLIPDTLENWKRIWSHHPALKYFREPPPMGWVLEADGQVV